MKNTKQFTITGNNPLKHFFGKEDKPTYDQDELYRFYFSHYPEKETADWDEVTAFYNNIGAQIQLATN